MQVKKAVMVFLIVSLLLMPLLPTIELPKKQLAPKQTTQELFITREMFDDHNQLLIEELDKKKLLQQQLYEAQTEGRREEIASRGEINNYDISRPSGRTAEELEKLVEKTAMKGLGSTIYKAEQTYGISGLFIVAVARLESGGGTTYLARTKNNLFGLNAWGKTKSEVNRRAYKYSSKASCIMAFSKIIRENYIDKGRNTIKTVSDIYCELPHYWYDKITILLEENIRILNK